MKKTKEMFMEQRVWEDRLELLPYEEEFIYLNHVQDNKRRTRNVLGTTPIPRRANKKS